MADHSPLGAAAPDAAPLRPLRVALTAVLLGLAVAVIATASGRSRGLGASSARRSTKSARQLLERLERLPILEQDEARARLANQRVIWPGLVQDIERLTDERNRDIYRLILQDPRSPDIRIEAAGFTRADLKLLRSLRRSQRVTVAGGIEEVRRDGVAIQDAKLVER